jgi:hypothetical protein
MGQNCHFYDENVSKFTTSVPARPPHQRRKIFIFYLFALSASCSACAERRTRQQQKIGGKKLAKKMAGKKFSGK